MSCYVRKHTFRYVLPAKIQISLRIYAVSLESSLGAFGIAKDAKFLHADNEDTGQTVWKGRLIWVFIGGLCQMVCFLSLRLKLFVCIKYK